MSGTKTYALDSCSTNSHQRHYLGYIDGTITPTDGMPAKASPEQILIHREKAEYKVRKNQIAINILGLNGGRPYVDGRLSRYAGESEIDWIGGKRGDGSCATGRLQQTHAFPYLRRIDGKINQYVFMEEPKRETADEAITNDITRDGQSVNDIMRKVSSYMFATKWSWIGIHAPAAKEDGTEYTVLEKEQLKLRPYWQWYSPLDVVDWKYDGKGELLWLKTRGVEVDDSNPMAVPEVTKVIKLWQRGFVDVYRIKKGKDKRYKDVVETERVILGISKVPFIMCGEASGEPIAFDDLESINRTIMDLGSVDRANFYNCLYPQLILPASVFEGGNLDGYTRDAVDATRLMIGMKHPIKVPDDSKITPSYLMPDSASMQTTGERISTLMREMFEVTGLSLEQNSKQVASAEAKAWDFLDVSAIMKARAEELEDIEKRCVAMMQEYDSTVTAWEPIYNRDFDVGDFLPEIQAITMFAGMNGPPELTQYANRKGVERMERIGSKSTPEDLDALMEAIRNYKGAVVDTDILGEFGNGTNQ